MDDDSRFGNGVKIGLGALGLGAVGAVVMDRHYGIWIAAAILVLFLLLFGGYFIWRRIRARRQRERFTSAIEAQTAAAPKAISDPNKRAALDKLRQKFQTGLQEFRSRGKDIYKLPWYVIIGEPGSGKTEAIRHSGIDFPPGLQDELQGSGGTVNMDWWFTNRGIILDTAGSMIFGEASAGEAPEWREFLRLLKKSRPHCPVNGLFLVLSIESLIKDSADTIAKKASRLAQQLDIIQRALDVRFPVYLLVTKCDLLAGFREFFDSIDDPLLQHQIFGWSNPEPLDSHFRPDLVDKHLTSIADRLRRRRMALLRDNSTAGRLGDTTQIFASSYQLGRPPSIPRRLDEMDALFALPESILRLSPRLRLYLETVFVAGEWSAKPVFLRGIYFTTSMREGKALDEAIAQATGLSLDQLPEERNWEKKRAFFLRDLFHEKIFREAGLVTRATNTLKLLRTRQLAIFGSAAGALLILLGFAWFGYRSLQNSVGKESAYWRAGANGWQPGIWSKWWSSSSVAVPDTNNPLHFSYTADNQLPGLDEKLTIAGYHERLRQLASKRLSVGWIFAPIYLIGSRGAGDRATAQRILFERGVLAPLVEQTRAKMTNANSALATPAAVARHRDALQSLMLLEADGLAAHANGVGPNAENYLKSFIAYLTDGDYQKADTNLTGVFTWTYSKNGSGDGKWPPKFLLGGNSLDDNQAIKIGLEKFYQASKTAQTNIELELGVLDNLADDLRDYQAAELTWLTNYSDSNPCSPLTQSLQPRHEKVSAELSKLSMATNVVPGLLTNLAARYFELGKAASSSSAQALSAPLDAMKSQLPLASQSTGLFAAIQEKLRMYIRQAGESINTSYKKRSDWLPPLDAYQVVRVNTGSAHEMRWSLYTNACALASASVMITEEFVGDKWARYGELQRKADQFGASLKAYNGPLADLASNQCNRIAGAAIRQLKTRFVNDYVEMVRRNLSRFSTSSVWSPEELTKAGSFLNGVEDDLKADSALDEDEKKNVAVLGSSVTQCRASVAANLARFVHGELRFPLLPAVSDRDPGLSMAEMVALRTQIAAFLNELKTNWRVTSDLRQLQSSADRLNALLAGGDHPAAAKCVIFFVPPGEDDSDGKRMVSIFRNVRISLGQGRADWSDDLATLKDDTKVAEGSVDAPLKILFRRDAEAVDSATKTNQFSDWGLMRLIYKGTQAQDGTNWVIRIPLTDNQETKTGAVPYTGNVSFKVVLNPPLPKIED